ncbi:hypothetical protein [Lactiplantibacillus modestisalitolerans]|uniref:Uncharacterized protein n=1 Tax=Lactiplantibacillus modestisalitolerans TaxID=1457219 RepID=A0ABV5WWD3_9LACO|nr:hypothetical protein [Lactiplantibacillus modestisalitolerans]
MTFAQAHKLLQEQSDKGADTWYGPSLEKHSRVRGHLEWGTVELILFQLQKEYAPEESQVKDGIF